MARSAVNTKHLIVDAAYAMFWRQGFVTASMDDIATRAGVTKRTLYQHYRSKDDLIADVLAHSSELAMQRLDRITARLPPGREAMIEAVFMEMAAWAAQPRWPGAGFTRAVSELADLPGHPARRIAATHKAAVETWFADLLAKSGVTSARQRARELALLMEGALSLILIHQDPTYANAAAQAAIALVNAET